MGARRRPSVLQHHWAGVDESDRRAVFDDIEEATAIEVSPHSCRHYFGASLISAGVSVVAVSRWLGHSSPEIT
jgi:integrase